MNYSAVYSSLISSRRYMNRAKGLEIYYESHHIVPRCLGGNDEDENLALLTSREHFLAHWLLAKMYPHNFKIQCVWNAFSFSGSVGQRPSSRLYEYAKSNFIKSLRNHPTRKKEISLTVSQQKWINKNGECTRIHFDDAKRMVENEGWSYGRKTFSRGSHSELTKDKMRKKALTRTVSEETKLKHSKNGSGKIWIQKDGKSKFLQPDDAKVYLDNGWIMGRSSWLQT